MTAIVGYFLKKITKTNLIVEIPRNPKKSFSFEREKLGVTGKLKLRIMDFVCRYIIKRADHVKLLYPGQLDGYGNIKKEHLRIFHDFVPISSIKVSDKTNNYILFLGFPWYLKGVDILIRGFNLISSEFPECRLN